MSTNQNIDFNNDVSDIDKSFSVEWYMVTLSMCLCMLLCTACIIIQYKAIKWYYKHNHNAELQTRTLIFVYMVYIMSFICALQCFLCHTLTDEHYCKYGTPICVILFFATKSFIYGFFIERAKSTQKMIKSLSSETTIHTLPEIVFDKILPIYILLYFIIFTIIVSVYFRGETALYSDITMCLFSEMLPLLFLIGGCIDILNTICLLYLFLYPLYKTIKQHQIYLYHSSNNSSLIYNDQNANANDNNNASGCMDDTTDHDMDINNNNNNVIALSINISDSEQLYDNDIDQQQNELLQMITTLKINLFCTLCITVSSFTYFMILAFGGNTLVEYLWLGGNIDMMINSLCTFIMIAPNRVYVSKKIFCNCCGLTCSKFINCKFKCNQYNRKQHVRDKSQQ